MDNHLTEIYDQMFTQRKNENPSAIMLPYWEHHFSSVTSIKEKLLFGNILDLGCGTGEIDIWLARNKPDIHIDAVDVSNVALEIFNKHLELENDGVKSRICVHQSLITSLPFSDSHFDSCFISHTLEHIEDHTPIFNEIYRVLKPGGVVIAIVPKEYFHDDPTHVWHFTKQSFYDQLGLFGIVEEIWESPDKQEIAARIKLWPKPKIICMMRIYNEEVWLAQAMKSVQQLVDGFVILDDGSTDRTPEICKQNPKVKQYLYRTEKVKDESRDKNILLEMSLAENPDWIIALDGDELLENAGPIAIRREVFCVSKDVTAFGFQFPYLWDNQDRFRVDGAYWDIRHPRMFRVSELECDPKTLTFDNTLHGGNSHCGSIPTNIPGEIKHLDVCFKHYGYYTKEQREKKQKFHEQIDPEYAKRGFYLHLTDVDDAIYQRWRERKPEDILHYDRLPDKIIKILENNNNSLPLSGLFYLPGTENHLDLGSNSGVSLLGLDHSTITCVEKYSPAAETLKKQGFKVFEGDAREIVDYFYQQGNKFDRVTMFDFIEHLNQDDGVNLLKKLEEIAQREIVLFVPSETTELTETGEYQTFMETVYEQIPKDQRELQTHQSHWSPSDFQDMGYDIVFIPDFHFKGFDAFFAVKYKKITDREIGLYNIQNFLSQFKIKPYKESSELKLASIVNPLLLTNPERILIGDDVSIRDGARIEAITDYGNATYTPKIILDDGCHIEHHFHLGAANFIYIGQKVMIANRVTILDHDHGYEDINLPPMEQPLKIGEVIIDDEVWIGENAVICKDVYLGKHSVIGANTVVTHSIPPYCVAAGNPARIIKYFDSSDQTWKKAGKTPIAKNNLYISELKQKAYKLSMQFLEGSNINFPPDALFQVPENGGRGLMFFMDSRKIDLENSEYPTNPTQNYIRYNHGFHNDEGGFRWMSMEGQITIPSVLLEGKTHVSFTLTSADQKFYSKIPFDVDVYVNQELFGKYNFTQSDQHLRLQIPITKCDTDLKLRLQSNSEFVPFLVSKSNDMRHLSIHISELELVCKQVSEVHEDDHPDLENLLFKANQAASEGEFQIALDILISVEKLQPSLHVVQVLQASVMIQLGYFEMAEKKLLSAKQNEPEDPQIYNLLGIIKYMSGDIPPAKMYFHTALKIDPGYEDAKSNLDLIDNEENNSSLKMEEAI